MKSHIANLKRFIASILWFLLVRLPGLPKTIGLDAISSGVKMKLTPAQIAARIKRGEM